VRLHADRGTQDGTAPDVGAVPFTASLTRPTCSRVMRLPSGGRVRGDVGDSLPDEEWKGRAAATGAGTHTE
jgi:hypothetical protein